MDPAAARKPLASTAAQLSASDFLRKGAEVLRGGADMAAYAAYRLFRAAIKSAPTRALPYAMASWCFCLHRNPDPGHPYLAEAELLRMARAAVELGHDDPLAISIAAHSISHFGRDHAEAVALIDHVIEGNPENATAFRSSGWINIYLGNCSFAIEQLLRARQLDPHDPFKHFTSLGIGIASFLCHDVDTAVFWSRSSLQECPRSSLALQFGSIVSAETGSLSASTEFLRDRYLLPFENPRATEQWDRGLSVARDALANQKL